MEAKGRRWLKVTGILFLIVGVFQLISTVVFTAMEAREAPLSALLDLDLVTTFYGLSAILSIGAGALGVRYCANPGRAKLCFMAGMFVLLVILALDVFTVVEMFNTQSPITVSLLVNDVVWLALPICYLVGARKNLPPAEEE